MGKLDNVETQLKVLQYRRAGLSFQKIGQELGIAQSTAYRLFSLALKETRELATETAEEVKQLELERLDKMLLGCIDGAYRGNLKNIETVLRIQERRAKYLGLDAAGKVDLSGSGVIVQFVPATEVDDDSDES